jgi:hypothetical protein
MTMTAAGISARFWAHLRNDEVRQALALLDAYPEDPESCYERAELWGIGELGLDHDPTLSDIFMHKAAHAGHPVALAYVGRWSRDQSMLARVAQSRDPYAQAIATDEWRGNGSGAIRALLLAAIDQGNAHALRDYLAWFGGTGRLEAMLRQHAQTGSSNGLFNYGAWLVEHDRPREAPPFLARACARFNQRAALQLSELLFRVPALWDWRRAANVLVAMTPGYLRDYELLRRLACQRIVCRLHADDRIRELYVYGRARRASSLSLASIPPDVYSPHVYLLAVRQCEVAKDVYEECSGRARAATLALFGVLHRRKHWPRDLVRLVGRLVWDERERDAPHWITPQLADQLFE